jgi:stage II sporulation protein P
MASVATATSETQESDSNYFTVYDYADRSTVVLVKGGEVEDGDLYLSGDNKLYQICNVNSSAKTAYAKFIREESLPKYNITGTKKTTTLATTAKTASAKSTKTVGLYHTHNDESYIDVDGTDSVYGEGGIHDVGARLKENLQKLDISVLYDTTLHLPHNSGAYTRSLSTAQKLLDDGANAIFDVHRDSTPRSEYVTTVNGEQMSKIRMVVGSANQNYAENKNLAYSIKAYADEVYPNLIKDIYMGSGNYNQQLSPLAMLFEFGSENVEKELVLASTEPLSKIIDVVVFGSENASAISLADVSLSNGDGTTTVIAGLSNANSGASLTSLWVILACLGIAVVILGAVCIFSRTARYHTARFFSELFPFFRKK